MEKTWERPKKVLRLEEISKEKKPLPKIEARQEGPQGTTIQI